MSCNMEQREALIRFTFVALTFTLIVYGEIEN